MFFFHLQFLEPDLNKGFLYPKLKNVHAGTITSNPSDRHEILISVKSSFPKQFSHKINPCKIRNLKNQFIFSFETFELFNQRVYNMAKKRHNNHN